MSSWESVVDGKSLIYVTFSLFIEIHVFSRHTCSTNTVIPRIEDIRGYVSHATENNISQSVTDKNK